ncbi:hypothetical protein GCM10020369_16260 [Cryptosporangium minutisporangium]|uniref:Uncharacterized protein n=1 Tax=Cryptosporangium minutisporangium TaxID=113569 RepID=A0ABP6SV72_9ACTN
MPPIVTFTEPESTVEMFAVPVAVGVSVPVHRADQACGSPVVGAPVKSTVGVVWVLTGLPEKSADG